MSSAMGTSCLSTATLGAAPLSDVVTMLPLRRPVSPYTRGTVLLRSPDGKLIPYEPGGRATDYVFDIVFSPPGKGKSVLLQTLNLGTILSAGGTAMPFVAIIDIGFSSSGLISLLKESLPTDKRHLAAYHRLKNNKNYSINPFDTQLGFRYPVENERAYLTNLLLSLATPAGQDAPYDGMAGLVGAVVNEMYRWRADDEANAQPNVYQPGWDKEVDSALQRYNVALPEQPLWWDVVDRLFEAGAIHAAGLAQRYAVPILSDAISTAHQSNVQDLYHGTSIQGSGETLLQAFTRMINASLEEFRMLGDVTKFDIGEARVCSLDLQDVAPQGGAAEARQTGIMYMLARHVLVHHWWLDDKMPEDSPVLYRRHHEKRIAELKELPKRICYDEVHRTPASVASGVRRQIWRDAREGRKWAVQVAVASQILADFDSEMVKLATGVWVLGIGLSVDAVDEVVKKFDLGATAKYVVQHRLTGPTEAGAPLLLVLGATEARYVQYLVNTLGPLELWALSTDPVDVAVRTRLYEKVDPCVARRLLAASFPGGSAKREVDRRKAVRSERGTNNLDTEGSVLDELAAELLGRVA